MSKPRKLGKYIDCKYCKNTTYLLPNRFKKTNNLYCSRQCLYKDRRENGFPPGKKSFKHSMETRNKLRIANLGKKLSVEAIKKMADSRRGEKAYQWIKDRTKLKQAEKKHLDVKYKDWMLSIKKRDSWKCKMNNKDCKGRLEAHHILNWIDYPELRYDINNGITLCQTHHPRGRVKEKEMSPYLMELLTSKELF